jgi:hypothetical protein
VPPLLPPLLALVPPLLPPLLALVPPPLPPLLALVPPLLPPPLALVPPLLPPPLALVPPLSASLDPDSLPSPELPLDPKPGSAESASCPALPPSTSAPLA